MAPKKKGSKSHKKPNGNSKSEQDSMSTKQGSKASNDARPASAVSKDPQSRTPRRRQAQNVEDASSSPEVEDPEKMERFVLELMTTQLRNAKFDMTNLMSYVHSYSDSHEGFKAFTDHLIDEIENFEQDGKHSNSDTKTAEDMPGVEQDHPTEQTPGQTSFPATLFLDGDAPELGKIKPLGGKWSIDYFHKNKNGIVMGISSCNKRKRQPSAPDVEDNNDSVGESGNDVTVVGGRVVKRARKNGKDRDSPDDVLDGESGNLTNASLIRLTAGLNRQAPSNQLLGTLQAILQAGAPLDPPEVVVPEVGTAFHGSVRWGFK